MILDECKLATLKTIISFIWLPSQSPIYFEFEFLIEKSSILRDGKEIGSGQIGVFKG